LGPILCLKTADPLESTVCRDDNRKEAHVALALMIPLVMIMLLVLMQSVKQSPFSTQNHLGETLLLDGSDPALRIGVQVRRPWR
jgi:hypothetical protein